MTVGEQQPPFIDEDRERAEAPAPKDEAAQLFDELHVPLHRYLLCAGLGWADAEEAVQETFLRLHRLLRKHGDRTNLRGWVFQVARNLARDQRKSARWQRLVNLDHSSDEAEFPDPGAGPEAQAIGEQRRRRVRAAIGKLSPQQRECVLLRISGLRYREIAEILGINCASVGELMERSTACLSEASHE